MSLTIRAASAEECMKLWPAVSADHLFADAEAFRASVEAAPWSVRVAGRGEAALLRRWKRHLDVLAISGVWAAERHVPAFVADAFAVARARGFSRVLSPLLPEALLGGYYSAGMRPVQRIIGIQGHPRLVLPADPPLGVSIRRGGAADIPAVALIDAASFDEFWQWNEDDLVDFLAEERLAVAEANGGAIIGYTLATVIRGAATLTRLATAPHARNAGVGRALLAEAAAWSVSAGAVTFALCTQEANTASRSLYGAAGLSELDERYAFAMGEVAEEVRT